MGCSKNELTLTYDQDGKLIQGSYLQPEEGNWKATHNFTYTATTIPRRGDSNVEYALDKQGRIIFFERNIGRH